jgi:SSS family solute:Na+ symporter
MIMAVFWLLLYVVVNLTSILFLGALAISSISGLDFGLCMIALAVFAVIITLGGMNVIGYTDVIQVVFLILGGLVTTYLALDLVAEHYGSSGALNGFNLMTENSADHFQTRTGRLLRHPARLCIHRDLSGDERHLHLRPRRLLRARPG